MDNYFLSILGLELMVALVADFAVFRILKIGRSLAQWGIMGTVVVGATTCSYYGVTGLVQEKGNEMSATYIAYEYLQEHELNLLDDYLKSGKVSSEHKGIIELLSRSERGDFEYVYINAEKLKRSAVKNSEVAKAINELSKLSKDKILSHEGVTEDTLETIEDIVGDCFDSLKYSKQSEKLFKALYDLDKSVRAYAYDEISTEEVSALIENYGENADVMQAVTKYYLKRGDLDEALENAERLIQIDGSIEQYIIYTDIVAQKSLDEDIDWDKSDSELMKIRDKITLIEKKDSFDEDDESAISALEKEAKRIKVKRSINYILSKRPLFGDRTGLYDLQLSKLYLVIEDRERAKAYLKNLIEHHGSLSDKASLKAPLNAVVDAYNQIDGTGHDVILESAVDRLVEAQSQGVVDNSSETINNRFSEYVSSTLKYDKLDMYINRVDVSEYPNVKAYVSISGEKENMFGMASDFTNTDFEVLDTQYEITDFELLNQSSTMTTDIALVLDSSGSMEGLPLHDLKQAAAACINKMDETTSRMTLVEYDSSANVILSKSQSKEKLISRVNRIVADGGTDISSGLSAGINELIDEESNRAIILMSDGLDENTSGQINDVIKRAIENDITIFTVGLGDVDASYLSQIASLTGGKYMHASNSIELEDVYIIMQKYIVNNYCFSYTVTQNQEEDPRLLTVSLKDYYVSDNCAYKIGAGEYDISSETVDSGIINENTFKVTDIEPRSVSTSTTKLGITYTLSGYGFTEGMQVFVGDYELENVHVDSENQVTGQLKTDMAAGQYPVKIKKPGGKVDLLTDGLNVFRAGMASKVKIGEHIVSASQIGEVEDGRFIASGNVMVNGFIHVENDMIIEANDLPKDYTLEPGTITDLGSSANLSGEGNVYISFKKAADGSGSSNTFGQLVLGGRNYVISDGAYNFKIRSGSSDFIIDLADSKFYIPFIADIKGVDIDLYPDRLQVNLQELNPWQLFDSIKNSVENLSTSSQERRAVDSQEGVEDSGQVDTSGTKLSKGSAVVALTKDDIKFGFEVELNNKLALSKFGLNQLILKLNSLDSNHQYWKLGGGFDLGICNMEGLSGAISSYYWCPDEIGIDVSLDPGILIYKVFYIDKLGVGFSGLSTMALNSQWISDDVKNLIFGGNAKTVKAKDFILYGTTHAGVNLFKMFGKSVPDDLKKWGELGEIDNGKIQFNCTAKSAEVSADLKLASVNVGSAKIGYGNSELNLNTKGKVDICIYDVAVAGSAEIDVVASLKHLILKYLLTGKIDSGWLNVHESGEIGVKYESEFDGSYQAVTLTTKDDEVKCWYDSDGEPVIWDRFHVLRKEL